MDFNSYSITDPGLIKYNDFHCINKKINKLKPWITLISIDEDLQLTLSN